MNNNSAMDIAMSNKLLLSNLTITDTERAARQMAWDEVEERIRPYIVDMTQELPEPMPLISIDGCCICSRGNISAICGEAKSKKTFLASALVASAMALPAKILNNFSSVEKNPSMSVLWVDTEQGEQHVRKVVKRISAMTGALLGGAVAEPRLTTLALRELAPMARYDMLIDTVYHYPFDLIVIDGIADLQRNTNDLEESDGLVTALMALSTKTNTHILCILHTNPGTDKARGHLGSSLQRKAETVLYVHKVGESSVVEPQFCRNEPFERFAFHVNEEGIPELCELPATTESANAVIDVLNNCYGGAVERTTLINKLVDTMGISHNAAKMKVYRLITRGKLEVDDNLVRVVGYGSGGVAAAATIASPMSDTMVDDEPPF